MANVKHPCDCCERKNWASGCSNCIWDMRYSTGCGMSVECMHNYEGLCTLGVSDECKASSEYKDELINHDCSECIHYHETGDGEFVCKSTGEEIGKWDDACEDFEEGRGNE